MTDTVKLGDSLWALEERRRGVEGYSQYIVVSENRVSWILFQGTNASMMKRAQQEFPPHLLSKVLKKDLSRPHWQRGRETLFTTAQRDARDEPERLAHQVSQSCSTYFQIRNLATDKLRRIAAILSEEPT